MSVAYNDISPIDLRDYLKSVGWQQRQEGLVDGLVILSNTAYHSRQLAFPIDTNAPDYADAIELVLQKVAGLQSLSIDTLVNRLTELNDDTIRFRVVDPRHDETFLPLTYAVAALAAAKDLMLSAASTVLQPQMHHPRKPRTQAREFVDKVRFHQTEKGSFVLKVSAPIRAVDLQVDLFGHGPTPFVRKTTLTISQSIDKLVTSIENDQLNQLVEDTRLSPAPELSANLCKALVNFRESHDDFDLYVDFAFATSLPVPPGFKTAVKIQKDYFSRISDVGQALRKAAPEQEEESFLATVEHLAGDVGPDGRRAGEVILNLYNKDEERIEARAYLNADQYAEADKAHMTFGTYIKVIGMLQPGYQPRNLTILHFEVLP